MRQVGPAGRACLRPARRQVEEVVLQKRVD